MARERSFDHLETEALLSNNLNKMSGSKLKIILLFIFFGTLQTEAQIGYGLKAGLNISDVVINNVVDPDSESDYDLKLGLHGGVFCFADLDNRAGLSAELLYSNKGVKAITNNNLHYVNFVVLLKYALKDRLTAEAGPEVGYLIVAQSKYGVSNIWNNKLDLGLDLGLQYDLSPKFILGVRFNAGFSSVVKTAFDTTGEKIRYQNRVLQFSLGYVVNKIPPDKTKKRKPGGYKA